MKSTTVLLIHGANLNMLGKREARHYGVIKFEDLIDLVKKEAKKKKINIKSFQSNHEGDLIDFIQNNSNRARGIIINPGAFTHYSYAIHDALLDAKLPAIEVHLSDIQNREEWRKKSVTASACRMVFKGEKEESYIKAISAMSEILNNEI